MQLSPSISNSRRILIIVGTCFGPALMGVIFSALNMSLASIHNALPSSLNQIQWIINIYGIFISVSLVAAGRLADIYGRKLVYLVGLIFFSISMLGQGLSHSVSLIIFFEIFLGLAGAVLLPVSQAIITNIFPEDERSTAIGIWAAVAGVSLAVGPLVAGGVLHALGWRWVFLIMLPLAALSFLITLFFTPETKLENDVEKIDWLGVGLLTLTIGSFVLAVMQGSFWSLTVVILLYLLCLISLALLLFVEKRVKSPIIREDLFRNRTFVMASLGNCCIIFFAWAVFFLLPLYLQKIRGFTPLQAGLVMLFVTIPLAVLSPAVGRIYQKIGPKKLIIVGFIFLLVSSIIQMQFHHNTMLYFIIIGTICYGIGWGLSWNPTTTAAISSLPPKHAGIAAGTFVTIQEIGGTVGLAITGTVFRRHQDLVTGYDHAMWVLVIVSALGFLTGLLLRRKNNS